MFGFYRKVIPFHFLFGSWSTNYSPDCGKAFGVNPPSKGRPLRVCETTDALPSLLRFSRSQRSGGENTAKTLSELEIHDSRNTALSGFRLSSAIAPARQNQFRSS
jgi:hypothetical protein